MRVLILSEVFNRKKEKGEEERKLDFFSIYIYCQKMLICYFIVNLTFFSTILV